MRIPRNIPSQFRLDSDGNAQPNEIARFVDSQLIEGAGITLVDDAIPEQVEIGNTTLRASKVPLNEISSAAGQLDLNFNLGTVFRFVQSEDVILSFSNLPANEVIFFTLIRIQDQTTVEHDIDWDTSIPEFIFPGQEPPVLTYLPGSIDMLLLNTYNGGASFVVNFVGNFA